MAKFTFEIDVYSDPICPWCYIGKEALDRAMATYTAQHPDADFKLTWKPYMLWPNAGVSAYDKGASLRAAFGARAPVMLERLDLLGTQYGIDFRWEGKTGNSRDAHKLQQPP
ncbi:DSBA-like thioredoxin domain-containing protein [Chaetomidium leptoderma]|uniref:DSBA-like thioredoxin domain-containing protein n=1 Tax=Chaetomidium leptoderma TaxID=669021 RepID=A0AAN6VMJ8_9PEZI|nr:DSBA-like thioredoxin domain-containing protein [Chaetomidium leptoderma]